MPERFVDLGPDGKLVYETDSRGNRVPDYSYAGYQGGGIALPTPPASVLYTLASYSNWGWRALTDSNLMATSSPLMMLVPNWIMKEMMSMTVPK